MRLETRLARLEEQQPGATSATVRRWLGWPVTDAEMAAENPPGAVDASALSAAVRKWFGL